MVKAVEELWKGHSRLVWMAEWLESDGLLHFHGKIYVPDGKDCWGTYAYMHICTMSIQIYFGIFFDFILVLLLFHCSHTVTIFFRIFPYFSCHFIHFKSLSF